MKKDKYKSLLQYITSTPSALVYIELCSISVGRDYFLNWFNQQFKPNLLTVICCAIVADKKSHFFLVR